MIFTQNHKLLIFNLLFIDNVRHINMNCNDGNLDLLASSYSICSTISDDFKSKYLLFDLNLLMSLQVSWC